MGRADKKFCNDQWRNSFNNNLNKDANESVRNSECYQKKKQENFTKNHA